MYTDEELRKRRDDLLAKGDKWMATLLDPCEFCKFTWHKHPMHCPHYTAMDLARCAVQHQWFLRGAQTVHGDRIHEYECNICSINPHFVVGELLRKPHPWCAEGKHFWMDPCYCGCQGNVDFCTCGAKRPSPDVRPA